MRSLRVPLETSRWKPKCGALTKTPRPGGNVSHPPPLIHDTDADHFSPVDHGDDGETSSIHSTQQERENQEQSSAPCQEMTFEDLNLERPVHNSHTRELDSQAFPPLPSDRPWLGMQSTHSSHTKTFNIDPDQQLFDPSSIFNNPAHLSHHQQGIGAAQGHNTFGAFNPASLQTQKPNGFSPPETSSQGPPQPPFDGLNASRHPERAQAHAPARRGRGIARRGQPRPRGWTREEEQTLLRMHAESKDEDKPRDITKRVAKALGKSVSAVEGKYWRLRGGDPKAYKKNCKRQGDPGGYRGGRGGGDGGGGRGGGGVGGMGGSAGGITA